MSATRLNTLESHITPVRVGYQDVTEQLENVQCSVVQGEVPSWIAGSVYRQAGGAFMSEKATMLDALAHVASWKISNGTVTFTNKFLDTEGYRAMKATGIKGWAGTVKSEGYNEKKVRESGKSAKTKTNPNVNFWVFGKNQIAASSEFPQGECLLFDPDTLESVKTVKPLPGANPMNKETGFTFTTPAHFVHNSNAKGDYHFGTYLRMKDLSGKAETGYKVFKGKEACETMDTLVLQEFDWGQRDCLKFDEKNLPSYMHAVGESNRYVVGLEPSKKIRFDRLNKKGFGFFEMYTMRKGCGVSFAIFDKKTEKFIGRAMCPGRVGMMFHVANCYDDDNGSICLTTTFSSTDAFDDSSPEIQKSTQGLCRFTINVESLRVVQSELITTKIIEFPTVNPAYLSRPARFVYGVGIVKNGFTILRFDTETSEHCEWSPPANTVASEPVFVPRGGGELGGVLVVPSINVRDNHSSLIFVDPSSMGTVAVVRNPIMVNFGLHNLYVPDGESFSIKC